MVMPAKHLDHGANGLNFSLYIIAHKLGRGDIHDVTPIPSQQVVIETMAKNSEI
jgi:hypothetical protein